MDLSERDEVRNEMGLETQMQVDADDARALVSSGGLLGDDAVPTLGSFDAAQSSSAFSELVMGPKAGKTPKPKGK
eukprot:1070177-Alexandrium_andersonii.AAC.2